MSTDSSTPMALLFRWWILAAVFITQMVALGATTFSFGLFVQPLGAEFSASRAELNSGMILILLGQAVCNPILGRLIDRYSVRLIMIVGLVATSIGLMIIAYAQALWIMAAATLLLLAPGVTAVGPLCGATLVAKWFDSHRGKAMAISSIATSMGGFVIVPYLGVLIEQFGWRMSLQIHSIANFVFLVPLVWFVIGNRTEMLKHSVLAKIKTGVSSTAVLPETVWNIPSLMRDRNFWLISATVGVAFSIGMSVVISIIPYGTDLGLSITQAAWLLSTMSVCGIAGKMFAGFLADHYDKRILMTVALILNMAFLMILYAKPSYSLLLLTCVISGLTTSGVYPLYSALLADCYGKQYFGTVLGTISMVSMPLGLVAIWYVGFLFDKTGNYDLVFLSYTAMLLISIVLINFVRLPTNSTPQHSQ